MAVSQKQIAERLGVSIALVSRVLSGKARTVGIADATIERVLAAAEEMGYVPSAAALTLKGKASRTLGVVVYDFRDPFFGPIIEKLQEHAHERGYSLVIAGFMGRHPEESDLAPLHKHAIDGLIILGSSEASTWIRGFEGMPIVRIGHGSENEATTRVSVDEEDAVARILDRLAHTGWKRCVFLGAHLYAHEIRYAAFQQAAATREMEIARVDLDIDGFDAGFQAATSLLNEEVALLCATDVIAMGAARATRDAGRALPVVGFDDIPSAGQYFPSITTIHQPLSAMVRAAFRAVLEPSEPCVITLPGELIERSSA